MRLDDICIVNTDVTASDDFYREGVGLERRMRNVRFADFLIGDGPRLAMWMRPSIAETVGEAYPTEPGLPFRVTVELADHPALERAASVPTAMRLSPSPAHPVRWMVTDPDGFVSVLTESVTGRPRIAEIELTVSDPARTYDFLERLGFVPRPSDGRMHFDGGNVLLTIVDAAAPCAGPADHASFTRNGGHLMLAIELETGEAVDEMYADLVARGLQASGPPAVFEWGARSTYFVDPDGYIWEIYAWIETPK
jgi:catechol 2,3-dioxygenase-like lactoylglutathione lyase family enzyme